MLAYCVIMLSLLPLLGILEAAEPEWPEKAKFVLLNGMCVDRTADGVTVGAASRTKEYIFPKSYELLGLGTNLIAQEGGCLTWEMSPLAFCVELMKFVPKNGNPCRFLAIEPSNLLEAIKKHRADVSVERT